MDKNFNKYKLETLNRDIEYHDIEITLLKERIEKLEEKLAPRQIEDKEILSSVV